MRAEAPPPAEYAAWRRDFAWDVPARLNMAEEVCGRWARAEPERPAILTVGETVEATCYGALWTMAQGLAQRLAAAGVGRGDRVGVYRSQSAWTAAAHIAVWTLGAVSVPLFVLFGPDALRHRLSDAGCVAAIAEPGSAGALAGLPTGPVIVPEAESFAGGVAIAETGPEDPAVLIYTSGSTGQPKGALHGHRVLRGHLPGVEMSHDLLPQPGDVLWTPADWAWIGGLFDVLMPGLWHGVPVVAARMRKFDPEACRQIVARAGVRNVFFPPTALRALKAADAAIPGLRSVASGGEPLGAEMLDWGRRAFGVEINEFYGQTECNMIVSSCAALFPARAGAMGKPVPGHDVAVIDAAGRPTEGEGDIAVRRGSASMMLGYWRAPEATAARFRGDWLVTGDRGVVEDGYIRFVGRQDDVITSAGYRIGPAPIEDCLMTHPAVANVGVVGVPDPERTEAVAAFVVLRPGWEETEALRAALRDHVRTRLAAHEYPRRLFVVDELPTTVTGKVLRRELRRRAAEDVA